LSDTTTVCPACGALLRQGAKFCTGCGKPVAAPRPVTAATTESTCAACGNPLKPGAKFCNKCGAPVVAAAAATTCAECGNPLKPGAKFCNKCGTPVAAAAAPTTCAECGNPLAPGVKFCNQCGATVVAQRRSRPAARPTDVEPSVEVRRCQSCGRIAEEEENYCGSCNAELPRKKGPPSRRVFVADLAGPAPAAAPAPRTKTAPIAKPAPRGMSSTSREVDFGDAADAAPLAIADLDPLRTGAETPTTLRGRDAELAALKALLEAALQGKSGWALIVSERGLGKTRLLSELASAARTRGFLVAAARGGRFGVPVALDVFRQWLVATCDQFADGAYGAEQRHRASVATALGWTHVPALPDTLRRRLEQLFDGAQFEPAGQPLELQQRMLAGLVKALWTFAQTRPLCLLVDDADAADPASCELLCQLVGRLPDSRMLLVAAGTPALPAQCPGRAPLVLNPLAETDAHALAGDFIEHGALPPELAALLTERAVGNPRLITAQMRELLDKQVLTHRAGSWSMGSVDTSQLLAQPRDLTQRKVALIEAQQLPGLQLIAAFGQRTLRAHFDAACACLGASASRALDAAVAAGLLTACERSPNLFEFGQQGSRGDLLDAVDAATRHTLQLDIATGYRNAPLVPAALSAELVARHLLLADASSETCQLVAALVADLTRRGLLMAAGEPLKCALAMALESMREADAVTADSIASLFELAAEMVALLTTRDPVQASNLAPRLFEQLRGRFGPAAAVPLLQRHALALAASDRVSEAVTVIARAAAAWPADGDPLIGATLALDHASLLERSGALEEAAQLGQRSVKTLDECAVSDRSDRTLAGYRRGQLHLLLGRCCQGLQQRELAQRWIERGRQLASGDGLTSIQVQSLLFLASIASADPDPAPMQALLKQAQSLAESDADPWSMAEVYLAHGRALLAQARTLTEGLSARSGLSLATMQRLQKPATASTAPDQPPRHRCKRAPGTAARADGGAPHEGMQFDPVLLAEQVVINEQLKKDLLYCDAHLAEWCHFELLGIPLNASTDDVRKAYFAASKRFHPDRYFRKNTGSYGDRIGRVFEAIKTAYNVLCDDSARAAYEATLDWQLPPGIVDALKTNRELQQRGIDLVREAIVYGRLSARTAILDEAMAALTAGGAAPA